MDHATPPKDLRFAELSYYIATVTPEELFRFLVHAGQSFVPLEKLFFGTDYPGFLYDPVALRAKLLPVNDHAERVGHPPIPSPSWTGSWATTMPACWD